VHIGNHHGYDGYIFLLWALICSLELDASKSEIANVKNILIHSVLFATCIGMASYGVMAIIEDFLNEQVIKRGYIIPGFSSFASFFGSMEFFAVIGGIILISSGIYIIYLRIQNQSRVRELNKTKITIIPL
jgi:small neutral amino acid transporter SnatA (MarC family)